MYEVTHERQAPGCGKRLREALKPHRRVLVHVGFPDMPDGFYEMLLRELAPLGTVTEESTFGDLSRAAVIELAGIEPPSTAECVVVYPLRRW